MSGRKVKESKTTAVIRDAVADGTGMLEPIFKNLDARLKDHDARIAALEEQVRVLAGAQLSAPAIHLLR